MILSGIVFAVLYPLVVVALVFIVNAIGFCEVDGDVFDGLGVTGDVAVAEPRQRNHLAVFPDFPALRQIDGDVFNFKFSAAVTANQGL